MAELYRRAVLLVAFGATTAVVGCGSKPSAEASPPDSVESTKDAGGALADSADAATASATASATATAPRSDATAKSRMFSGAEADTNPQLIAGRQKRDGTSFAAAIRAGRRAMANWPTGPAALSGAVLPANRVVAYYGNPHSKRMGVLGEYPEQQMLSKLDSTVALWRKADPSTPVVPAIHLVAVVAQGDPGPDGGWRRRESAEMIERTYGWAKSRKGLLILDIQGGHSTLDRELPPLLKYLERPDVHLGVDPEFYMHYKREGVRPSAKVGQMMASDINYVIRTLDSLVKAKNLPPKILVVHRFRADMVPDAESIKPTPRVQVVMDMDGWGPPWLKFDSYRDYIVAHPVQFTGFKIFYHNDTRKGDLLLTPGEVLHLLPRPLYIQYQ
jgi:hypothetical protein